MSYKKNEDLSFTLVSVSSIPELTLVKGSVMPFKRKREDGWHIRVRLDDNVREYSLDTLCSRLAQRMLGSTKIQLFTKVTWYISDSEFQCCFVNADGQLGTLRSIYPRFEQFMLER